MRIRTQNKRESQRTKASSNEKTGKNIETYLTRKIRKLREARKLKERDNMHEMKRTPTLEKKSINQSNVSNTLCTRDIFQEKRGIKHSSQLIKKKNTSHRSTMLRNHKKMPQNRMEQKTITFKNIPDGKKSRQEQGDTSKILYPFPHNTVSED